MIIGVAGKAGCGKDTVADYLVKYYAFRKDCLAAPIKRLVQDVFVLPDDRMNDRTLREQPLDQWPGWTVRKLLQYVGTELFRTNIDPDIWVKSMHQRISRSPEMSWVIPDIRFPNELEYFRREFPKNFICLRVDRPGLAGPAGGISGHVSESFVLEADHVIRNDATLWDLYNTITLTLAQLGLKPHCAP